VGRAVRRVGRRLPFLGPDLEDAVSSRVVLITGASSGIGRATALRLAGAGATVALVARGEERLAETQAEIAQGGAVATVHPADLTDEADIDRMADAVLGQHGRVDILVNNAGRSIRRSIALSYDRMHDFRRTMELNYFGAVKLILKVLPGMRERGSGHIVNVSSLGVQTNTPRFSAYVASKSALDAFSRCIASEIVDDGVHISTVYMPLVRTPMIAPTDHYRRFPARTPEEAADLIARAIVGRHKRVSTPLGRAAEITYATVPMIQDAVVNTAYKLFPDTAAARGGGEGHAEQKAPEELTPEQRAFERATRGVHW
jgi:NAD(P)-dependent dehydrogenase (short-subunit alcohol dehydrogenase family)